MVSDVITQQTRIVSEALDGVNNGWNEAVEHLLSPSPPADTMSSDQVHSLIKQFQPIPSTHRPVDNILCSFVVLRISDVVKVLKPMPRPGPSMPRPES